MEAINEDLKIQTFLSYLEDNANLKSLTTNLDNNRAPVHRWFPFLAGFSHKLVEETVKYFCITDNGSTLFDPFMGSGTTGVVSKEFCVDVIGNESNVFLYEICKLKTNSFVKPEQIMTFGKQILKEASSRWKNIDTESENPLLKRCYPESNLEKLVTLRELLNLRQDIPQEYKQYLSLAVTMSLSKSANVGINIPYVSWSHERVPEETFLLFKKNVHIIEEDLNKMFRSNKSSTEVKLYLHDSRTENKEIKNRSVDMIFTSPPYLNNLDYGEALKVFLYFWKIAENWSGISQKIRKQAIVSSTTYYSERDFVLKSPEAILGNDFINKMPTIAEELINKIGQISAEKHKRKSKKSFDILTTLYFKDMSSVIEEMHRVLKKNTLAFIVIGDSAPYGVHIPTDTLLGEMAVELGFSSYTLRPLRVRGVKWVTLRYRHNKKLRESLLILRR
jgi:DNA modification methylase